MEEYIEQVSRATTKCVNFIWKIENFTSLRKKTGECVRSKNISCSDSQFVLKLYPNGKCKSNDVDVVLEPFIDFVLPIGEYKISLKDRFGQKWASIQMISKDSADESSNSNTDLKNSDLYANKTDIKSNKTSVIDSIESFPESISAKSHSLCSSEESSPSYSLSVLKIHQGMSVPRDLLFKHKDDLLPDHVLTVLCSMKVPGVVKVSEQTEWFLPKIGDSKFGSDASLAKRQTSDSGQMSLKSPEDICQVHKEDSYLKQGSVTLSKNIENLFESSLLSDVTLKVGADTFQAHKNVLACRSKVFEAMFESGMKEGLENEVNMVDMKSATAKEMLQYIYAGKIQELSMDRAMDLYVAADRYDLQELRGWCKDFILKHISADDVTKVAVMADLHNDEELKIGAKKVFKLNSKTIPLSKAWEDFARENFSLCFDLMKSALVEEN